jgi:hypothetical protein
MAQTNETGPSTPPKIPNNNETSDTTNNGENSGESTVQEGKDVVNTQEQEKVVNEEAQEEYINDINIQTTTNSSSQLESKFSLPGDEDDEDDDDEDDDDDDDGDPIEIGDDPAETKKKIPVM